MTFHIRYGLTARAWPQIGLLSALAFMGGASAASPSGAGYAIPHFTGVLQLGV